MNVGELVVDRYQEMVYIEDIASDGIYGELFGKNCDTSVFRFCCKSSNETPLPILSGL
jgi:hypothetical protein